MKSRASMEPTIRRAALLLPRRKASTGSSAYPRKLTGLRMREGCMTYWLPFTSQIRYLATPMKIRPNSNASPRPATSIGMRSRYRKYWTAGTTTHKPSTKPTARRLKKARLECSKAKYSKPKLPPKISTCMSRTGCKSASPKAPRPRPTR